MLQTEKCVQFKHPEGFLLRGIMHCPAEGLQKGTAVIILNTGLNDMTGWHRLQVKLARHLAKLGYPVLRFDDGGIGDSEGEIVEESIVEIFCQIETGLFVPSAGAAADYLAQEYTGSQLVYVGFCGGGLTGLLSAVSDSRIAGVFDIASPITLSSNEYLEKKDPWVVRKNVENYRRKIFHFRPWLKFLTGRGDYGTIMRSVVHFVRHASKGEFGESNKPIEGELPDNINKISFRAYEEYSRSKRPIEFYFAELDSATWEFKKYFLPRYQNSSFWDPELCGYTEVAGANHIFSSDEAQEGLKRDLSAWLDRFE